MTDTADIILRLRCQHTEIAHCAADAIERLVASEEDVRQAFDKLLDQQVRTSAQMPVTEIGGWSWRDDSARS